MKVMLGIEIMMLLNLLYVAPVFCMMTANMPINTLSACQKGTCQDQKCIHNKCQIACPLAHSVNTINTPPVCQSSKCQHPKCIHGKCKIGCPLTHPA